MRNDCQYVCLWDDTPDGHALLHKPDLSVGDLLRAAAHRQQREAAAAAAAAAAAQEEEEGSLGGGGGFYQRALVEMTAFFDQLAVGRALEPVRVRFRLSFLDDCVFVSRGLLYVW